MKFGLTPETEKMTMSGMSELVQSSSQSQVSSSVLQVPEVILDTVLHIQVSSCVVQAPEMIALSCQMPARFETSA